jgi:two-component system response regulator VicR
VKILLVDDDRELVELLSFAVQRAGMRPIAAHDGASACKLLDELRPDLVVLDVRLGSSNGLDVLKTIRRSHTVPVIMLSALDTEDDKVNALDLGADDYVTKPFAFRELVARIRACLRRPAPGTTPPDSPAHRLRVGSIELNPLDHTVTLEDLPLPLTVTEFRLLKLLMGHAGQVVPHSVLLKQVWGYQDPTDTDVVRATVYRLRRKLVEASDRSPRLRTIPGVGVMLQADAAATAADEAGVVCDGMAAFDIGQLAAVAA